MPKGIFKNPKERAKKISKSFKLRKEKLGYINSPMARKKLSETKKRLGQKPPSWKGKKHSVKTKERISKALRGEKSFFWKGGISFEPYSVDWTKTLKRSIRQRDKYTCQVCGKEPAICVHHIDYDKKNCNPKNLITLCKKCHGKTNNNREYWISYLKVDEGN